MSTNGASPAGSASKKGQPVRFAKLEPGDEQILPPREQRELDGLPSGLDRKRDA
jgi:hypothetical protein